MAYEIKKIKIAFDNYLKRYPTFSGVLKDVDGVIYHCKDGELHREDGPAVIEPNGSLAWFFNGKPHREDGPAFERVDGSKGWYIAGKTHREDGPAIETPDGSKCWYQNGERHRKDGPALEYADGSKGWFKHGKMHREDGPAHIGADGEMNWLVNDEEITDQVNEWMENNGISYPFSQQYASLFKSVFC